MFLSMLFLVSIAAAAPFAEKADGPANLDSASAAMLSAVKVPDKSEVSIPAYPGAKIFQASPGQSNMLPMIRLLSTDDEAEVVKFYEQKLKGWKSEGFLGSYTWWEKGTKKDVFSGKTQFVEVGPAKLYNDMMPSAKTYIGIWYMPGK